MKDRTDLEVLYLDLKIIQMYITKYVKLDLDQRYLLVTELGTFCTDREHNPDVHDEIMSILREIANDRLLQRSDELMLIGYLQEVLGVIDELIRLEKGGAEG